MTLPNDPEQPMHQGLLRQDVSVDSLRAMRKVLSLNMLSVVILLTS